MRTIRNPNTNKQSPSVQRTGTPILCFLDEEISRISKIKRYEVTLAYGNIHENQCL